MGAEQGAIGDGAGPDLETALGEMGSDGYERSAGTGSSLCL